MACSAVRSPLLRKHAARHYAVAATAQRSASAEMEVQTVSNKLTVAALNNDSPISRISVVFRAGSRNETYETQGTVHHLRIAAGLGTQRSSFFGITRNIQQLGGMITATTDRESIAYTLQVTRDNLDKALTFFEDVTTKQMFKPWEISDQLPRLRYELSTLPESSRIVELLHKAAYRAGLGYSLYSPKWQVGKIGTETLQHFVNTWFTTSRCSVVSCGVPMSEVSSFATNLNVSPGENNDTPSKYWGGELRKDRASPLATVAVAVEGASLNKEKDAMALAVLQRIIGSGPRVKWGSEVGPLHKQLSSVAGADLFALSGFNVSYSDSGLFGFVLSATPNVAGPLTKAAYKWLKSPNLSDADIARGKTILKADILSAADNNSMMLENMVQQILAKGRVSSPAAIAAEVDKLSASDIKAVAGNIGKSKPTLAAIGDLSTVPYVEELS